MTLISDTGNPVLFSPANIWEVVIKNGLGRTDFSVNPFILRTRLLEQGFDEIAISSDHAIFTASLPPIHRDPFDRILVAQATVEGLTLLTADPVVASYPGPILLV